MTQAVSAENFPPSPAPPWVAANIERLLAARGRPDRLKRLFDSSLVPMVIVDGERRCVEVNTPARLAFRLPLAELRRRRIEDLTPEHLLPTMRDAWRRLRSSGSVCGPSSVASPDGSRLDIHYYALANALPGLHLIAFAPAGWPGEELLSDFQQAGSDAARRLTKRELQVLELAADGASGPTIATELGVSVTTVRTHFGHIYEKLEVGDRAAAVAKAMRTGMIT